MLKGMPMIVQKQRIADTTCPSASQTPANKNQMTLPSIPKPLLPTSTFRLSSLRLIASFPNGKNENWPITKHALPHGIPIMVKKHTAPMTHQARPMKIPPRMNQRKLPIERIAYSLCRWFSDSCC
ncbi:hypothetical protein D3C84_1044180 [compost metagenome]